jgi:propanol-preferring alcohol dehydrogenase
MVLRQQGAELQLEEVPTPEPGPGEVRLKVSACGICRTDLHVLDGDGELTDPALPLIMGHQIVGVVDAFGNPATADASELSEGDLVGVPWLGSTCGECRFCNMGQENLCDRAEFTGYDRNGGFAEYCTADVNFCFPIPQTYPDRQAAPLLCAGLIGYRSFRKVDERAERIGLYGFGSAAHILCQVLVDRDKDIYAFTRPGDTSAQSFAEDLGATWAGHSEQRPPEALDAAIIFAPVGPLVPEALRSLRKGGEVVCAGIHMSDIPSFPYDILWGERSVESVANLSREDGDFLQIAPQVPVETEVTTFGLEEANEALEALREGDFNGSGVLLID